MLYGTRYGEIFYISSEFGMAKSIDNMIFHIQPTLSGSFRSALYEPSEDPEIVICTNLGESG